MKNIVKAALVGLVAVSFASCGGNKPAGSGDSTATKTDTTVKTTATVDSTTKDTTKKDSTTTVVKKDSTKK